MDSNRSVRTASADSNRKRINTVGKMTPTNVKRLPSERTPTPPSRPSSEPKIRRRSSSASTVRKRTPTAVHKKTGNPYWDKENMVLPAVRNKNKKPSLEDGIILSSIPAKQPTEERDGQIECEMNPKERQTFYQAAGYFGEPLVDDVCCKNWQHRKRGLDALHEKLKSGDYDNPVAANDGLHLGIQLIERGLKDKILQVQIENINRY